MQKFYLLRSFLIIFIAAIVIGHAGADPNKKAQEQINQVMSEAMKGSDLPTVVAVGIDSKGNQFDFMHGGLSWGKEEKMNCLILMTITPQQVLTNSKLTPCPTYSFTPYPFRQHIEVQDPNQKTLKPMINQGLKDPTTGPFQ